MSENSRQRGAIEAVITAAHGRDPKQGVENLVPLVACAFYGCPGRPERWLSRFTDRPWRCQRCRTWWVTVRRRDYDHITYDWHVVDGPDALNEPDDAQTWDDAQR